MNRNSLAAFGVVTAILSPLIYPITIFSATGPKLTLVQSARGLFLFAVTLLIAFGLISLRKWAALYFSLPLFAFGISQAFFAIEEVTFPFNLLVMLHGLSLTLPLIVTIRIWKHLTWGSRFF